MDALRKWIRVAEVLKSTCLNATEFEALIRHQRERLQRLMNKDIKAAIRSNINSLFDAADLLVSKDFYGPAIHLMMAAREESVKWMLVHCWSHLDQKSRAKIFSHDFKHKTAGIFYFLSGQLQAMDLAIGGLELLKDKAPEISQTTAALIELLPKTIDDPESIAKSIVSSLYSGPSDEPEEISAKRKAALAKLVDEAETLRQTSIYIDFDQSFKIRGRPQDFGKEDYEKIKKDVVLARYHIDKVSGLNPNKDVLHSTFPEWKDDLEKSLKDLATKMDAQQHGSGR
jgi:AbiV family abortive infection protein